MNMRKINHDSPIIYSDADGVCLNWIDSFIAYCSSVGHVALHNQPENFSMVDIFPTLQRPWELIPAFQQSPFYTTMKAYDDAKESFAALKAKGADIVIVTSCGKDDFVVESRKSTVEQEFAGAVSDIIFLDYAAPKLNALKKLRPGIFIDDQEKVAIEGHQAGHCSLLRDRSYNIKSQPAGVNRILSMNEVSVKLANSLRCDRASSTALEM